MLSYRSLSVPLRTPCARDVDVASVDKGPETYVKYQQKSPIHDSRTHKFASSLYLIADQISPVSYTDTAAAKPLDPGIQYVFISPIISYKPGAISTAKSVEI
ncbi:hypothetical protein MPTK1_6g03850 [Marchantia polymorpha subsp. ruderalis]|uniref:Uncharacterized protein n=2 Tax=Marchantia polymorpha TaxID=3197 RepID=A0AAF6BN96_MARPO|nr:hypothetical protein MARPO_0034s0133 [Marchantia polymorpha]BBN13480.1 hypothetical protein Mp_6g03850 [Marchantia polymorpha subsp. ruderalis]|eukprot:PTQ41560.1 hypothetical protein MARPO_0034s0133 [Marchantia polymorpha]